MLDTSRLAAQASVRRPRLLGAALSLLEWLEGKSGYGEASHRIGLASQGLQTLLAMEEQKAWSYSEAPLPPPSFPSKFVG